jgi:hypothetical protein
MATNLKLQPISGAIVSDLELHLTARDWFTAGGTNRPRAVAGIDFCRQDRWQLTLLDKSANALP